MDVVAGDLRSDLVEVCEHLSALNSMYTVRRVEVNDLFNELTCAWTGTRNEAQFGILDSLKSISQLYEDCGELVWRAREALMEVVDRL